MLETALKKPISSALEVSERENKFTDSYPAEDSDISSWFWSFCTAPTYNQPCP